MQFHGAEAVVILCAMVACTHRAPLPKDAWDAKSATFGWWGGEVKLPPGFIYQVDQGADTFVGRFTSPNRALVVHHDIGGYAGAYASRKGAFAFEEKVIDGARVWTAKKEQPGR